MQTAMTSTFMGVKPVVARPCKASAARRSIAVRAGQYDEELIQTAVRLSSAGGRYDLVLVGAIRHHAHSP